MNKEDVIKLYNAIENEKAKGSVKFRYALLKNENLIKQEIEALTEIETCIEKIIEPFTKERNELIKSIGVFDAKANSYQIPAEDTKRVDEFLKKVKPIQEKYKKIIAEHDKKYKEYIEMLKEELGAPLKFVEIEIDNCPEDLGTNSIEILMKCGILK